MATTLAEEATFQARRLGRAFLKFISPNEAGITGSKQEGFLLAKGAWRLFTP